MTCLCRRSQTAGRSRCRFWSGRAPADPLAALAADFGQDRSIPIQPKLPSPSLHQLPRLPSPAAISPRLPLGLVSLPSLWCAATASSCLARASWSPSYANFAVLRRLRGRVAVVTRGERARREQSHSSLVRASAAASAPCCPASEGVYLGKGDFSVQLLPLQQLRMCSSGRPFLLDLERQTNAEVCAPGRFALFPRRRRRWQKLWSKKNSRSRKHNSHDAPAAEVRPSSCSTEDDARSREAQDRDSTVRIWGRGLSPETSVLAADDRIGREFHRSDLRSWPLSGVFFSTISVGIVWKGEGLYISRFSWRRSKKSRFGSVRINSFYVWFAWFAACGTGEKVNERIVVPVWRTVILT